MRSFNNRPEMIAFFGHFDSTNFGNESTLQAIIYHLRQLKPNARLMCISTGPRVTMSTHNIEAIPLAERYFTMWAPRNPLMKALRRLCVGLPSEVYRWASSFVSLRRIDALIIPGTGLLTDAYGLAGWGPYNLFKWSLVAKLCGCKLLVVSVGAGPIYGFFGRWLIKAVLSLADFRSYRDNSTIDYLRSIGFKVNGDQIFPDLAFSLPQSLTSCVNVRRICKTVVGLGVMKYAGKYSVGDPFGTNFDKYCERLVIFAGWLLLQGYRVRLLSGDLSDVGVRGDFKKLLGERVPMYNEDDVIDEPITSVEDLLSQIAATEAVVATRFHNVLLALLCNKPVISISFHHKCESLMKSMGLSEYCLDINKFTAGELIDKFSLLVMNAESLKNLIAQGTEQRRKALSLQYKLICNLI